MNNYPTSISEGKKYEYNFWKNKPVIQFDEFSTVSQQIEDDLTKRKVYGNDDSIILPNSMKWIFIDMKDDNILNSVVDFLKLYYINDIKNKFKLDYTIEFLKWAIGEDGFMIAIVSKINNIICGVVGASIRKITVFDKTEKFGIVNFLCAHPIYIKKKIAFTLIDEIIRRIVKYGINRGCFTTERCVPTPITVMRYYYRPINYIKLQKHGFTYIEGNPEIIQNKFMIKDSISKDYIQMQEEHILESLKLYILFMSRFNIYCNYTEQEFKNILLDNKFVKSYVIMNDNKVIDFVSYYELSYFMDDSIDKINAGYLFLHSCNNISIDEIIENLLKLMKYNNIDILNITDNMLMSEVILTKVFKNDENSDNEDCEKVYEHKFLKRNKKLHFNFFNWRCPEITPKQISWFPF